MASTHDNQPTPWESALTLGNKYNQPNLDDRTRSEIMHLIDTIREHQGHLARISDDPATIVFGTSGWRGRIGEEFTVLNVRRTVRGIIDMMHSDEFLAANGYSSFEDVQNNGIVVFRDNRFMGDEFMAAARSELVSAGIKVYMAGECPTGVGSALVTELGAAGSINFTPSHNPMDYAGIKFNPADGGPAAKELTSLIEVHANGYMKPDSNFAPARPENQAISNLAEKIDAKQMYTAYLEKTKTFDLERIRTWLLANKDNFQLVVDFMHGSSRGYVEAVLGKDVVEQLVTSGSLVFLNTNDDPSFHGIKPEPSPSNQRPIIERLAASRRKLTLGVFMDPDADRIRFADAKMDIPMNLFGAIAFADAMEGNAEGGIATTVASSSFALEIARQNNRPVFETAVGFKFFRPHLTSGEALVGFEESDGISFGGHTLEKDAIAGFLAALTAMVRSNSNLSDQYAALQERYGYFYPRRSGVDVKGVTTEAWQAYKKAVLDVLTGGLVKVGDTIEIGGTKKKVTDVITKDGLKVVFNDRSWLLMRPSGTEPKFRIYIEPVNDKPIENIDEIAAAYEQAGADLLAHARSKVDG
jgi:phosphomannomutase